jgi:hypothetical protein
VEVSGGQTLLEACALDIKALETISSSNGLQDAIEQVESGFLTEFCERYVPFSTFYLLVYY